MLFSKDELLEQVPQVLKGRDRQTFLNQAARMISEWVSQDPAHWMAFGPYWPIIQGLIQKYLPGGASVDWGDPPDYLAHYSTGNDLLDWIGAMNYLNRDGGNFSHAEMPHSIQLADGSQALYQPGLGIIDT